MRTVAASPGANFWALPLSPPRGWLRPRWVFPKPKRRPSQEHSTNPSRISNTIWRGVKGGSAKESTVKQLPVATSIAGVSMRLKPGGLRELHWHAIAAEWAYVVEGKVRTTVISPDGEAEQTDFGPGDVWFFPKGHGHALQGVGPDETHFILGFDDGHFSEFGTFSITDWLGHTPSNVLSQNLGLPESTFATRPCVAPGHREARGQARPLHPVNPTTYS